MTRAVVRGVGMYVPERVVTNDELARWMDTSDEWIRERTGIRERRWVEPGDRGSRLAAEATRRALEHAGLDAGDLDAIVFATLSPDHYFPGNGVFLQRELGVPGIPCVDVRNQCTGFLYALSIADAWIRTGTYRRVAVVGSEIHSVGLDRTTRGRDVTVLFGDGAGTAILEADAADGRGVLRVALHADGRHAEKLWLPAPGSSYPEFFSADQIEQGLIFPRMEGREVFKHAVVRMPQAVREVLAAEGLTVQEVDLLIPHQANLRISEAVQKSLGLPDDKVFNNIQRYANTTAATIPMALAEAVQQGRLTDGNLLCLAAFGSGFTWGAALVRW
ncbi:MAG: 3-oxoacyl-ACP synthase III family protein [Gemmatimonadota bacterium]